MSDPTFVPPGWCWPFPSSWLTFSCIASLTAVHCNQVAPWTESTAVKQTLSSILSKTLPMVQCWTWYITHVGIILPVFHIISSFFKYITENCQSDWFDLERNKCDSTDLKHCSLGRWTCHDQKQDHARPLIVSPAPITKEQTPFENFPNRLWGSLQAERPLHLHWASDSHLSSVYSAHTAPPVVNTTPCF